MACIYAVSHKITLPANRRSQAKLAKNCDGLIYALRAGLLQSTQITHPAQLHVFAPGNIMERQEIDVLFVSRQPGDELGAHRSRCH